MDKLKLTSSFAELVKSVNKKAVLPEIITNNTQVTPLIEGETLNKIYIDTSQNIDEFLGGLTYEDPVETIPYPYSTLLQVYVKSSSGSYHTNIIALTMSGVYALIAPSPLSQGILYVSQNATEEILAQFGLTHAGWQCSSFEYEAEIEIEIINAETPFLSSTPILSIYEKSNGGIYLRALADGTYEWTNARETVFPSASEDINPTALNVGDKIDALYFDSSRDIDADLAALTYNLSDDGTGTALLLTFEEGPAVMAVSLPPEAFGTTDTIYFIMGIVDTEIPVYFSKNMPNELLAQIGATQSGWQISSYVFPATGTISGVGEDISYLSSTPFSPEYSNGLFLRNTADGEYKWENPFPELKLNLAVGDALPSKIYFDTSVNLDLILDSSSTTTIIETNTSQVLISAVLSDGGVTLMSTSSASADWDTIYVSPSISDTDLSEMSSALGIEVKRGWNKDYLEFISSVVGTTITTLYDNTAFITRDATAEDYEKGLYLKLLKDGSRTWGTPAGGGNSIESIEQTTTSTADSGTNIITVTLTDGTKTTFQVINGSKGSQGAKGATGETGAKGDDGTGISSIEKTNTEGLVDTYTITLTDGRTTTFTVTNGKDGEGGGTGTVNGIENAVINENGELVLIYTDGTEVNLGTVVGADGEDGRGILEIILSGEPTVDGDYTKTPLQIRYSDMTAENISVSAKNGTTGRGVLEFFTTGITSEVDGYTVTPLQIRYTDGTYANLEIKAKSGASLEIDDSLSSTSENPVQNKVIAEALEYKLDFPSSSVSVGQIPVKTEYGVEWKSLAGQGAGVVIDTQLSETSENPVQNKAIAKKIKELKEEITNSGSQSTGLVYADSLPRATNNSPDIISIYNDGIYFKVIYFSVGLTYTLKDDGTYEVSDIGTCKDTRLVIPAEHQGVEVTSIANNAFENSSQITYVDIPDTVVYIGNYAFANCTNLTSLIIPKDVAYIGSHLVDGSNNLNQIYFKGSKEDWEAIGTIGTNDSEAFNNILYNSQGVPPLSYDNSGFEGGYWYYDYDNEIKIWVFDLTLYYNFLPLGENNKCAISAKNNVELPSDILIPSTYNGLIVSQIQSNGFKSHTELTSITIPENISIIEPYALQCENLTSVTFKSQNNWVVADSYPSTSLISVYVADSSENANLFKETYASKYWFKASTSELGSFVIGESELG